MGGCQHSLFLHHDEGTRPGFASLIIRMRRKVSRQMTKDWRLVYRSYGKSQERGVTTEFSKTGTTPRDLATAVCRGQADCPPGMGFPSQASCCLGAAADAYYSFSSCPYSIPADQALQSELSSYGDRRVVSPQDQLALPRDADTCRISSPRHRVRTPCWKVPPRDCWCRLNPCSHRSATI